MNRKITYGLFGGAGALVVAALAFLPHHRAEALPPVPQPLPPPIVKIEPVPVPVPQPDPPKPVERPRIDVVFALDTTGSMSGLIEGAKRKIWMISDYIASGQPTPEVRIGLVAYRDVGDEYVTRFYDLSDDLDTVFKHLQSFKAAGGGDTPEHVGKALYDAVERSSWAQGDKVTKMIYLVGDAPPHTDYQDGYNYLAISKKAAKKGIHINTIRCGSDSDTEHAWAQIAKVTSGDYASIEQAGGFATVVTPYDTKLAELNRRLAGTALGWGSTVRKHDIAAKVSEASAAPTSVGADRAGFAANKGMAVTGEGELLNDLGRGKAKLDAIATTELPAEMQGMKAEEKNAYIVQKQAERTKLIEEINRVSAERKSFLTVESKKSKRADSFDSKVRRSIAKESAGDGVANPYLY